MFFTEQLPHVVASLGPVPQVSRRLLLYFQSIKGKDCNYNMHTVKTCCNFTKVLHRAVGEKASGRAYCKFESPINKGTYVLFSLTIHFMENIPTCF